MVYIKFNIFSNELAVERCIVNAHVSKYKNPVKSFFDGIFDISR